MRKILCMVLILLICLISTFANAAEVNNTVDLQVQRNELKNQLDEASAEMENVQSDLSENLQQVEKLDSKIEKEEQQLQEQESKISEYKESIKQVEDELKIVTEKYEKQKKILEDRVVLIYEAGDTRYLDILLKSRSLTDFISSYYIITELIQVDENLLTEIESKKRIIEVSKEKLELKKNEMANLIESQTRLTRTLQNTKKMRESFIAKLSEEERELQAKIDEINAEYDKVNRQILLLAQQGLSAEYIGGALAWPVPGYTMITSKYGMRVHPITGVYKLHTGVDISAPLGANFIAVNDGIVVKADYNTAYGNMVIVDHGGGISTLYAHGSEILVTVGQEVKRGEAILKVGSTGYSTGPHAHFEVRLNGIVTDPIPYITNGLIPGTEEDVKEDTNIKN